MIFLLDYGENAIFIILLFASILSLAVVFERALVLRRDTSARAQKFRNDLVNRLRAADVKSAMDIAALHQDSSYGRFAQFSLALIDRNHSALSDLMEGKIIEERISLEKRLTILNTLGNNAPFIGLLGTVLGIVKAFHGLGTMGNSGAEIVMRSISSALLATAAGLFVAIPVVMANNYFSRKVKIVLQNLEILSREFLAVRSGDGFADALISDKQ